MRAIFDLLQKNPILIILLIGWIISAAVGVLRRLRKAKSEPMLSQEAEPQKPTQEEVAARMRRMLGLDPDGRAEPEPTNTKTVDYDMDVTAEVPVAGRALPTEPRAAARKAQLPRPMVPAKLRSIIKPERPPQPLRPRELGRVPSHVAPHVGEAMQQRKAPTSGAGVAKELGMLGGRSAERRSRERRPGSALVDLHNLPQAIVGREIFDLPLSLRPPRS